MGDPMNDIERDNRELTDFDQDDENWELEAVKRERNEAVYRQACLEETLEQVSALLKAIVKRNQGGYVGDRRDTVLAMHIIDKALARPDAEGSSKIGTQSNPEGGK